MFNLQTYVSLYKVQLISAARNEHGLIREQGAQTTTQVVDYA